MCSFLYILKDPLALDALIFNIGSLDIKSFNSHLLSAILEKVFLRDCHFFSRSRAKPYPLLSSTPKMYGEKKISLEKTWILGVLRASEGPKIEVRIPAGENGCFRQY